MSASLHVLRVFVDADGAFGNPLGVFLDGSVIPPDDRPGVAADLGFSETVFVEDARTGRIRIHTPARELPFAGHPSVGTAWLLAEVGMPVDELQLVAGPVPTWTEGGLRWVRARPEWIHPITLTELPSAAAVEALTGPPPGEPSWYVWAWVNRPGGSIRSRYFAGAVGIAEDEATGAAAVLITGRLRRDLEILQGRGSRLSTRFSSDGSVELGGRVVLDQSRSYG
jgi:predicted PhzF superfamily epimerase YddE/YHI9